MSEDRDHRDLGYDLDLFTFHEETGPGLPLFHPKGNRIRRQLKKLIREQNRELGYGEVWTPHLFRSKLWKESGHYEAFKERMFMVGVDEEEYSLKPMNCPAHSYVFKARPRSYRDLPLRLAEFGTVYRDEQSGELTGLFRVRSLTIDDGHIFLMREQIEEEILTIVSTAIETLRKTGIDGFDLKLSTKPEKAIGDEETWEVATDALKEALKRSGHSYVVEEGEGAFYGPKIDIDIEDSLGRNWQCSTIQLDFFMPKRFDLQYTGEDGEHHTPILIHRALLGSLERFIGILMEHHRGRLPVWLSPEHVRIIPVAERHVDDAMEKKEALQPLRVTVDDGDQTVSKKIFEAQKRQVPYMVVIGDREVEEGDISVRDRNGNTEDEVDVSRFRADVIEEVEKRLTDGESLRAVRSEG